MRTTSVAFRRNRHPFQHFSFSNSQRFKTPLNCAHLRIQFFPLRVLSVSVIIHTGNQNCTKNGGRFRFRSAFTGICREPPAFAGSQSRPELHRSKNENRCKNGAETVQFVQFSRRISVAGFCVPLTRHVSSPCSPAFRISASEL